MCSPFPDCEGHYTILFPRCQVFSFPPRKVSPFPPEPTVLETEVRPNYFACSAGKTEIASSKILRFYYDCDLELDKALKLRLRISQQARIFQVRQIQSKYANADSLGPGMPEQKTSRLRMQAAYYVRDLALKFRCHHSAFGSIKSCCHSVFAL